MKYIFEVTVKDGHSAEEYADAWVRASELIQQAPGAVVPNYTERLVSRTS